MLPENVVLGDAQSIILSSEEAAAKCVRFEIHDRMPVQIVRKGWDVKDRPDLLLKPLRRTGKLSLLELTSFASYFSRFADIGIALLFVDTSGFPSTIPTFTGIINAHDPEPIGEAGWQDFGCSYQPKFSVEWNRWMKNNGQSLAQDAFLEVLADNLELIKEPKSSDLMALIESLNGSVNVRFERAMNLFNGKMKLHYSEDVKLAGGAGTTKEADMEVPTEIICGIAPFEFGDAYKIKSRLRYRIQNRQLFFSYEVMDAHKILTDAVAGMTAKLEELTKVKVLFGKP